MNPHFLQRSFHHAFCGHVEADSSGRGRLPPLFETNDIYEAKDFAMRLAFDETTNVYVQDTRRDEIVRDFDAEVYRK